MPHQYSRLLRGVRQAALGADGGGLTDGQLLHAFLATHDECAFEAFVRRHGPMVLGVCRRVLRNAHDAEDAFQAAFLVLIRKAASLAGREIVGDWLHGVAYRTALKARTAQARRRVKERQMPRCEADAPDLSPEWPALLDQELNGLPQKYRVAVILCDLEGRTHQEAARRLGCPVGTISGRLSRARALLARRLRRRGLTLSTGLLAAALCPDATAAAVSRALVGSTVKAATLIAAGQAAAGIVSARVAVLTEGVVKAMLLTKLKTLGAVVLVVALVSVGAGALRPAAAADEQETKEAARPTATPAPPAPVPPAPQRMFQVQLQVDEEKDGEIKHLSRPTITTWNGRAISFMSGGEVAVHVNRNVRFVPTGVTVHIVVSSADLDGEIELDMTVSRTSAVATGIKNGALFASDSVHLLRGISLDKPVSCELKSKDQAEGTIRVTATVAEVPVEKTIESAEKDFKVAEFYRRSGKIDSALFYYQVICRRYPDTLYATQAKERIAALKNQEGLEW
jgi:RNA polymerase sigma factor (sigma-70 family)